MNKVLLLRSTLTLWQRAAKVIAPFWFLQFYLCDVGCVAVKDCFKLLRFLHLYIHCESKKDTLLMSTTSRKIDHFTDSFTDRLRTKFSTKYVLYRPPFFTDVAALPCDTAMFQKSYKFKNTILKDVVLKYFCGCTCLISFSRQIRVSVKNYEMSVHIKYSVHNLIYDIHICASAAMTQ